MAKKILTTTIALRRDTINNYASHSNHVPEKGEVCIVDPTATTPWAKAKNIRIKIGDGETTFGDLKYVDQENSSVFCGYYYNSKFYADINHTEELEELESTMLYVDLHTGVIYYYDGEKLVANVVNVPTANDERPGILKLYQVHGQNTDGTMSQKAITDAIDAINLEVIDGESETFSLAKPW